MALLSREEIACIRERARVARVTGKGEALADDIDRLLEDLAAAPPLVVIAPHGASNRERAEILRDMEKAYRGPVCVLPFGWREADAEQADALSERTNRIESAAREQCAKVVEGMRDVYEAPEIAKTIRALNEPKS